MSLPVWIRGPAAAALLVGLGACSVHGLKPAAPGQALPPQAVARYQRALERMKSGDDAGAEQLLEALRSDYPGYAGPAVNLGIIRLRDGRDEAATQILQQAVSVCSHCAAAYNQLGIAQRRQGRFSAAEHAYLAAIDADAGYSLAWFNLGVLYDLYLQRPELAVKYYRHYLTLSPDASSQALVSRWIADLQRRLAAAQPAAGGEPTT